MTSFYTFPKMDDMLKHVTNMAAKLSANMSDIL